MAYRTVRIYATHRVSALCGHGSQCSSHIAIAKTYDHRETHQIRWKSFNFSKNYQTITERHKLTSCCWKIALVDIGLPEASVCETNSPYLWSAIKQIIIKYNMPTHFWGMVHPINLTPIHYSQKPISIYVCSITTRHVSQISVYVSSRIMGSTSHSGYFETLP